MRLKSAMINVRRGVLPGQLIDTSDDHEPFGFSPKAYVGVKKLHQHN